MNGEHGGDWAGYYSEYGKEPLDFSANVSPLGLPEGVRQAVIRSLDTADRYPDPECRALRRALARARAVNDDWILCGNGASDVADRLIRAIRPGYAVVTAPCFSEYGRVLRNNGCKVAEYRLSEANGFRIGDDILDMVTAKVRLAVLCEPNNPTGVTTSRGLLERLLEKCRGVGCILLVDECFNAFLDTPEEHSLLAELSEGGLIVMRAFTKFYGMAGLRLGYCLSAETALLKKAKELGQPWPVSSAAQAAGVAALAEHGYTETLRSMIRTQRVRLIGALRELGFFVIPGEANYLLFRSDIPQLDTILKRQGILIRSCENFSGLGSGWYRIAVRTEAENSRLLEVLKEVV